MNKLNINCKLTDIYISKLPEGFHHVSTRHVHSSVVITLNDPTGDDIEVSIDYEQPDTMMWMIKSLPLGIGNGNYTGGKSIWVAHGPSGRHYHDENLELAAVTIFLAEHGVTPNE